MMIRRWFQTNLPIRELAAFLNRGELSPENWKVVKVDTAGVFQQNIEIVYYAEEEVFLPEIDGH